MRLFAKLSIPAALFLGIISANLFIWHLPAIGAPFILGYALVLGYALGRKFYPAEEGGTRTFLGILILTSIWTITGSVIFYLWKLDARSAIAMLALPLVFLADKIREPKVNVPEPTRISFLSFAAGAGFILLEFAALFLLVRSGTSSALRSPWERVPPEFFLVFFLSSLGLLLLLGEKRKNISKNILTMAHAALIFSAALLVFDVGFGFDPFVHRATESYILEHGTITPKTPYYAGEYALMVFLARTSFISISWINKLLLPILAAVSLPFLALWAAVARTREKSTIYRLAPLAPFALLLFPLSSFISTTPAGLANLFLIFMLFSAMSGTGAGKGIPAAAVFATASLVTHPLSGIPAFIFLALLLLSKIKAKKWRFALSTAAAAISSLLIPLTFVILSYFGRAGGILKLDEIWKTNFLSLFPIPQVPFRFNFFLDIAYLYSQNLWIIVILSAVSGYFLLKKWAPSASNSPFILGSFAVFVNSILLSSLVSFPALIDYEQGAYAARLREISMLFLLPLCIFGVSWFYERAKINRATHLFALLLLPAMMTAAVYFTYPRTDKYDSTHGYNTSGSDINAVASIEADAQGQKYIVLSNQALGAAALQEFGFRDFYDTAKGPAYFYSVPTGGPLYPYYLKMVYEEPSREIMREAMELAGVKTGYIAISHYWTDARALTEKLSAIADKELVVDGGKIYIYRFER